MWLRSALVTCLVGLVSSANAQTARLAIGESDEIYAGSYFVLPQDSKLVAPGIYRTIDRVKNNNKVMRLTKICSIDFRETKQLRSLYVEKSTASSLSINAPAEIGVKITGPSFLTSLKVDVSAADSFKFTANNVTIQSADSEVVAHVLTAIGANCKKQIRNNLNYGRKVYVIEKSIQAKKFQVESKRGGKANITIFDWFGGSANNEKMVIRESSVPVTIAIVPGEVEPGRFWLINSDLK